jgi:hypothetical protein
MFKLWTVILIFVFPVFIGVINSVLLVIPLLISEFTIDDIRNSHLITTFSNIIYSTIYLLFPLWLMEKEIRAIVKSFPSFGLLLSIPLILFIIINVIPFFIGANRFKHQKESYLVSRKKWVEEFKSLMKLPAGEDKQMSMTDKLNNLERNINQFLTKYEDIDIINDLKSEEIDENLHTVDEGNILMLLKENMETVEDSDIRFSHLYKLKEYQNHISKNISTDLSNYLDNCIDEIEDDLKTPGKAKNKITAVFMGVISFIITTLFDLFQTDIYNFLKKISSIF